MSEQENREDLVEKFFREKLENYEIPYHEKDWEKLEKRLDLISERYVTSIRRRWFAAAALLIISLLGYFTYQNYVSINKINQKLAGTTPSQRNPQPQPEDLTSDNGNPQAAGQKQTGSTDNYNEGRSIRQSTQKTTGRSAISGNGRSRSTGKEARLPASFTYSNNIVIPKLACLTCKGSILLTNEHTLAQYESSLPLVKTDHHHLQAAKSQPIFAQAQVLNKNSMRAFSHLSVGLVISPDLSTVGSISNFTDPGYKLGATIEYNLNSYIGISIGSILSRVHYLAEGRDYKPPRGFWTNGVIPYETNGKCLLIDIPINLKYNFYHQPQSRFYATAGVSSYIMLNEDYRFDYNGYDPGLVKGWSGKTGTRYWFSNASFSVGYEHDLFAGMSLRAEPFIRIPLKEVGWGKVKLYSVGSFVSINYRFR